MEHSAILLTFIKLPFVIKICVLSIFEWLLKTGFTVFLPLKVVLILANSADPDEMQHYAAFHLGFHCLLNSFRGVLYTKGYSMTKINLAYHTNPLKMVEKGKTDSLFHISHFLIYPFVF